MSLGTDDGRRWYFPVRHQGGGNIDEDKFWNWAQEELNTFDGDVVGAHLIYDLDNLWNYGVRMPLVHRFHDIQIAEPLLDEYRFAYNLDALAKDYLGEGKDETLLREAASAYGFGDTSDDVKANLWRLPASYVGPYAESDADLPLRILDLQTKKLEEHGLTDLFDLESRVLPILLAMRRRGIRVDMAGLDRVRAKLVIERDAHLKKVRRLAGPKAELMAPESFAKALIDRGLPVGTTAKSGQPSITKGWLKQHEGDELVDAILAGRSVNTVITTFLDGHFSHAINGRIHCEFLQLRDEDGGTGARLASRNPNMFNIPSRDEVIGPMVRGLCLPEEGEDWERHDQSQMEYRLQVHFARGKGATEARELYRNDPTTDFHNMCGSFIGADPKDKSIRKWIKGLNFAKTYGALAPKLASVLGVSLEEATKFINKYETALPFTVTTFNAAQKAAQDNGFVRSILGRYARYPFWEPADSFRTKRELRKKPLPRDAAVAEYGHNIVRSGTYKALNNILQYSNADYTKKVMVDVWEAGLCAPYALGPFLLQVYDELDYSVPRTDIGNEAVAEAKRLMEVAIELRVPVMVEAGRGKNWGECA
jgi:DNA polymerase I-like protein with 3'-5' exonuclease and polymerase domains